jgi:hypothetical protein
MNDAFATMEKNEIQLRQLRDIHRHTRRIIFAEQLCCRLLSIFPAMTLGFWCDARHSV